MNNTLVIFPVRMVMITVVHDCKLRYSDLYMVVSSINM